LRGMFNSKGWKDYTIAMCCTPAPEKIKFDVGRLIPLLDEWHVMTYDFASGAWSPITAHQSNLYPSPFSPYSTSGAVQAYLSRGVPPQKIYIGIPMYSRGFANSTGLGTQASGASPDKSWEDGVVDYKKLPLPGAVEMYDEAAQASYSYDAARKVFNSYDNPRAARAKCEYIKQKGLGGVIIWESAGDAAYTSDRSLLRVIHDDLLGGRPGGNLPNKDRDPPPGDGPPRKDPPVDPPVRRPPPPVPPRPGVIPWDASKYYSLGSLVSYNGKVWKCTMAHQAQGDWSPGAAAALWAAT